MKQKGSNILMKVLFCKIQCPPLFSLCKPSTAPIKLGNTQDAPASNSSVVVSPTDDNNNVGVNDDGSEMVFEDKEKSSNLEINNNNNVSKSCIRKKVVSAEREKKKVQWVDNFGKELVEIKEFESSDTGDDSDGESRICSCLIL